MRSEQETLLLSSAVFAVVVVLFIALFAYEATTIETAKTTNYNKDLIVKVQNEN